MRKRLFHVEYLEVRTMARGLTDKQKRFVEEYLVDLCGAQAAIRAGYSPRSAREIASQLLTKHHIRARVDAAMAERSKRTGINQDRVLRELARIAFVDATDVINLSDVTLKASAARDDTAAIMAVRVKTIPTPDGDGVEREVRLHDKLKALELLGKHLGMFTGKLDVNLPITVVIADDYGDDGDDSDPR